MRRRVFVVFGVIVLVGAGFGIAALTGGTDAPRFCTAMGCSSGVSIDIKRLPKDLPTARRLTVCVAGQCSPDTVYETRRAEGQYVPKPFNYADGKARKLHGLGPYMVTVTVTDRHGEVLLSAHRMVTMRRYYPNGEGCGGPCFVASLKLNTTTGELEPRSEQLRT